MSHNFHEIDNIIAEQEKGLRFTHFTNSDAWELGCALVESVHQMSKDLAICIRKVNGNIMFQHGTNGTNLNNQLWMNRKFNTVILSEKSSLRMLVGSLWKGKDMVYYALDPHEYVFAGGGFPIKLQDGTLVAVLTVSSFPHVQDHNFIVRNLKKYLNMPDVPELPETLEGF